MILNKKLTKKTSGFTIVELLIVIVVIGILAAITIVAYNGVQNKGKSSAAQAAANSVIKKAELYNVDPAVPAGYPILGSNLTTAAATATYALSGVTINTGTAMANGTAPATPNTVDFYTCGATVGNKIGYYDYVNNVVAFAYTAGVNSGTAGCTKTAS
jgi:prepilin-type N-terminal cleavage/methylation domain-containing protein